MPMVREEESWLSSLDLIAKIKWVKHKQGQQKEKLVNQWLADFSWFMFV